MENEEINVLLSKEIKKTSGKEDGTTEKKDTKNNVPETQEETSDRAIEPPENGWAWIVAVAGWIIHLIIPMPMPIFGILYSEILMNNVSSTTIGWIFAVQQASWYFSSFLAGPLSSVLGLRTMAFLGSFFSGFGIILSGFATKPWQLFIFYSVFSGFGIGMSIPACNFAVPLYFKKRRGLIMGLMMTCMGGSFFFAPILLLYLRVTFGYKWSIFILGAIMLNGCVAAMVLHPVEWHVKRQKVIPDLRSKYPKNKLMIEINDKDSKNIPNIVISSDPSTENQALKHSDGNNKRHRENLKIGAADSLCLNSSDESKTLELDKYEPNDKYRDLNRKSSKVLDDENSFELIKMIAKKKRGRRIQSISECFMNPLITTGDSGFKPHTDENVLAHVNQWKKLETRKGMWSHNNLNQLSSLNNIEKNSTRRLSVDNGVPVSWSSVYSLNSVHGSYIPDELLGLTKNIESEYVQNDPEKQNLSKINSKPLHPALSSVLSYFTIVKSHRVKIIGLSYATVIVAYTNCMMMIPFILTHSGYSIETASWAISVSAIFNICTRILISFTIDHLCFSVRYIFMFGSICQGIGFIGFALTTDFTAFMCCFALVAVGAGCCICLFSILIIEIMGVTYLPQVFSLNSFWLLIGILIMGPFIGFIRDWTESYSAPCICLACLAFASLLVNFFMPLATASDKRRNCAQPPN